LYFQDKIVQVKIMKKAILIINLTFLLVLAFLTAGILVTTQPGYAATVGLSTETKPLIICGSLEPSSANAKSSQTFNHTSIPGSNAGNGCMHQSGLAMFCMITSDNRRRTRKC
jgi:hypothetical protein